MFFTSDTANKISFSHSRESLSTNNTLDSPLLLKCPSAERFTLKKSQYEINREAAKDSNKEILLNISRQKQLNESFAKRKNRRHLIIPSKIEQLNQDEEFLPSPLKTPQIKRKYKQQSKSSLNQMQYQEFFPNNTLESSSEIISPLLKKQGSIKTTDHLQSLHEDKDNYNIWGENSQLLESGIDVSNKMRFVLLFYLRSQLYQKEVISKLDILDDLSVIYSLKNNHFNEKKSSKLIDLFEQQYDISQLKNNIRYSLNLHKRKKASSFDLHSIKNTQDNKFTQSPKRQIRKLLDCNQVPVPIKCQPDLNNEYSPVLQLNFENKWNQKLLSEIIKNPTFIQYLSGEQASQDNCNSPLFKQREKNSPLTKSRNLILKPKANSEVNSQPALFQLQKVQTESKNLITNLKERRINLQIENISIKQSQKSEPKFQANNFFQNS